mmetsp:Transcript_59943/g.107721  ORF Transcript_59943/g.107721 Transcript_59943/m.107721 type:complete len:82 (+) Transcript_59943:233-478(+)
MQAHSAEGMKLATLPKALQDAVNAVPVVTQFGTVATNCVDLAHVFAAYVNSATAVIEDKAGKGCSCTGVSGSTGLSYLRSF